MALRLEFDEVLAASNDTTLEEFVGLWATADKRTGFSMSGRHFRHF